jgi:hypothetical protein
MERERNEDDARKESLITVINEEIKLSIMGENENKQEGVRNIFEVREEREKLDEMLNR